MHAWLPSSRANGPGRRAVLWFQGCLLHCPGCFNPATHDPWGGVETTAEAMAARILALAPEIAGVTLTGGEPFEQPEALGALVRSLREASRLGIIVYSGFRLEEIHARGHAGLLAGVDLLVAGRYEARCPAPDGLRGSANQSLHFFTSRYDRSAVVAAPTAELRIDGQGVVVASGVNPLRINDSVMG